MAQLPLINAQTGTTYTLVLADAGKMVTLSNAAAIAVTIPLESSVAFAIGTSMNLLQLGAGQVTVAGSGGVTVNATPGSKTRAQYSVLTALKIAADTWVLTGDLQPTIPAFGAYQSTLQSLSAGTYTKLQFQTEEFDTDNCFDNATNYRFTPTVAGYYQFNAAMALSGASSEGYIQLRKNGSNFKSGNDVGGTSYSVTVSAIIYLNGSTDYVEVFGYSGTALNTSASQASTYFNGSLIRTG
jgi:hypothetical protein